MLPEHIGNIQFTSGTTGMPKAAALTHFRIVFSRKIFPQLRLIYPEIFFQEKNSASLVNNLVSLSPHLNLHEEGFHKDSILLNVLPLYHSKNTVLDNVIHFFCSLFVSRWVAHGRVSKDSKYFPDSRVQVKLFENCYKIFREFLSKQYNFYTSIQWCCWNNRS